MSRKKMDGLRSSKSKEAPAGRTAETSSAAKNVPTDDYSTTGADSQAETQVNQGKKADGTGRTRVFAVVVYPDSAPVDWKERLTQEHVQALISPLHDKDTNPDGTKKKEHWHVLIMFDGVKTREQVDALLDRVLGPSRVKHYETVNSTRGYARYLCHKDNPEKAQYEDADVLALGGADYQELIQLGSDDRSTLRMVFAYIAENDIRHYDELVDACIETDAQSMFALITEKRTLAVVNYLKAKESRLKEKVKVGPHNVDDVISQLEGLGYTVTDVGAEKMDELGYTRTDPDTGEVLVTDPRTGEVIGGANHDCQD